MPLYRRPSYLITPADLQSSFDTQICRVFNFKSSAGEGGSGYDYIHLLSVDEAYEGIPVDQELSAKIESELQMEKEMRDSEKLPSSLQDYLDSSSFEVRLLQPSIHQTYTYHLQLHDTPGQEEVVLTRKFGDES